MSSNGSFDRSATPLKPFCPCTATLYPSASNSKLGKASSAHLISCKQAMSSEADFSQVIAASMRALTPLMFQEAIFIDRKSTRLNSSHVRISYAVFCLKKKKKQ